MKCKNFLLFIMALGWSHLVLCQEKPLVLATASIMADMAKQVGGEYINVRSIVPIGGDPHLYEPTPGDAKLVSDADLILVNGLTFEGWINELINNSGTKAKVYTLTKGVQPIESTVYQNATDPHAWMNAENGIVYVENAFVALSELLPDKRSVLAKNAKAYQDKLKEIDQWIQEEINQIPESKKYLITSHDAFHYYGRKYGIHTESILGTSTDSDAQTSDIIRLNNIIRENQIPAVFIETTVNPKLLESLAKDNNIGIGGKLFSDSLGDKDSPASTYIDMLTYNTNQIVSALTATKEQTFQQEESDHSNVNKWLVGILALLFIGGFALLIKYII